MSNRNSSRNDIPLRSRWLRDPLVHFLLIGAVVFGIDYALASKREDPNVIVLDAGADAELRQIFSSARGREPNAEELKALRDRWFDNELLYREGLSLGLDRGDNAIRERVIFKALNVVQANIQLPSIDEEALRTWFEGERARYDNPPRVDFLEAVIEGKPTAEQVAAFASALNAGESPELSSGLRVFKGRPERSIEEAFGSTFAEQLASLPTGEWHAVESRDGPRAVRVEARIPGEPARFEALQQQVLQDWRDRRMQELRTDAVRALGSKYTLRTEGAPR